MAAETKCVLLPTPEERRERNRLQIKIAIILREGGKVKVYKISRLTRWFYCIHQPTPTIISYCPPAIDPLLSVAGPENNSSEAD